MKEGVRGKRRGKVREEDCVTRTERKIELDSCLNSMPYSSLVHMLANYNEINFTWGIHFLKYMANKPPLGGKRYQ